jgi:GPH family glycoside/pentoside/hexuronide:cation symporter
MMAGVLISTFIKKFFDRKKAIIFLSFASVVTGGAFYVLPSDNFVLLGIMNFIWSIIAGAMPVFIFAMFADVTDFHEWKFGQRATGLVISGIMFAIKMGVAVGGFLGLFILGRYGYVKDAPLTPEITNGIKLLFSIIPAGFILVCGFVLCFYPINEKLLAKIEVDLKERKSKE